MRLLNTERVELRSFADSVPPYAILSHTWEEEEVTFQDMDQGRAKNKKGYTKIQNCCSVARDNGYNYVWIDTCCIDKTSSAELTEAINSMYRYYREAEVCYSLLSDGLSLSDFSESKWFTRGWTLQELIAPARMIFFNKEWQRLGTKTSLGDKISERTGVPQAILSGAENLESASIAQRMSWAAGRKTTRLEDRAYSLMGIFEINMPLLYGEGHKAFVRLQEEILRVSDDHSIFAWRHTDTGSDGGLLAETPDAFKGSENIISWNPFTPYNSPFTVTNKGVHLDAPFIAQAQGGLGLVVLHCTETGSKDQLVGVYLRDPFLTMEHFERCRHEEFTLINPALFSPSQYQTRNLCIRLQGKVSESVLGSADSEDQELLPRHSTEEDQNSATDGAEDTGSDEEGTDSDEEENGPQQKLFLAASKGDEAAVKKLLALPDIDANSMTTAKRTPLSVAAESGHEGIVALLLNRREVDINSRDKFGLSPLSYAAALGHEKVVWLLLARSDIVASSQDRGKRTVVSLAARHGHKSLVEQLLTRKETRGLLVDGRGRSVLSYAAETGQEEVARLILGSGKVHPDLRDRAGYSALWYASKNGHTEMVELLLETGWVDPNVSDADGQTVLWHACRKGYDAIAGLLLNKGADPDGVELKENPELDDSGGSGTESSETGSLYSDTESWHSGTRSLPFPSVMASSKEAISQRRHARSLPHFPLKMISSKKTINQTIPLDTGSTAALWQAASRGYHMIVQMLLNHRTMWLDNYGCLSALNEAARLGHVTVIKVFLEKCPRSQNWDNQIGLSIYCAIRPGDRQAASVEILIKCLENVAAVDPTIRIGWLLKAALVGDEAIARLLLDNGIDVNWPFDAHDTLEAAKQCCCNEVTTALMRGRGWFSQTNLEPSTVDFKRTYSPNALWCAVVRGDETLVELLLRYGADTEAKIKEGKTVLFYAVSLDHGSIVRQLLKHGAKIEARDEEGLSSLASAVSIFGYDGNSGVLELLLDEGADVEAKDKDGNTPLMYRAWCLATVRLLLARGADVNAKNKYGVTPLMEAALYKETTGVVRLFLEHGADPTAKDERGRTAASQAMDKAVLTLLREYSERS